MIPQFNKILYTTDLSENARYAFAYAMSLFEHYDAEITLMHVLEDVQPFSDSLVINILGEEKWHELRTSNEERVLEKLRKKFEAFCDEERKELTSGRPFKHKLIIRIGNPIDELLAEIESGDYDLVIMGAHGHGIMSNALLGSVSRRVLRHSHIPVLVVRLPEET